MKQAARLCLIAVMFAALALPSLAAERIDEEPIFYQFYSIGHCVAEASGIGKVSATFLYYWDVVAKENVVASIMHVSYDLAAGYFGSVHKGRNTVHIRVFGSPGALFLTRTCKV